jgi:uncharacterized protein (TIGR02246 family)
MRHLLSCAVAAGFALACSHGSDAVASAPAASTESVRAAIAANNAEFARAIKAKDTATLTHLFTEDGIFVSPAGGFVKGWAALEPHWVDRLSKATFLDGGITTDSLEVRGDIAVEAARFTWTIQRGDGPPVARTGRALTVWQRGSDGRWRMLADHPEYDPLK